MSVVVPFHRARFTPVERATFREVFDRFNVACRWAGWELAAPDGENCEYISIMDGDGFAQLTLLKAEGNRYHAYDDEGQRLAEGESLPDLLTSLGLMVA